MAHLLAAQGVGPGQCVALLLSRSAEAVVAMLAVLKTGAAYLAIDPGLPDARIGFMLDRCRADRRDHQPRGCAARLDGYEVAVIEVDDPAIDTQPGTALPAPAPEDIAYLIYTSGTTGIPEGGGHHPPQPDPTAGVSGCRSGSCRRRRCGRSATPMAFDFSVWEIWGALLDGGRLVVVPEAVARSPEDFHALLVS